MVTPGTRQGMGVQGRTHTHDLVPLAQRARMVEGVRAGMAVLVVAAWLAVPATRGVELSTLLLAASFYVIGMGLAQRAWTRAGAPLSLFVGLAVMVDAAALAWASYGTAGPDSPLRLLLVLQLITVSLLGSFRLGLKLALWQIWLLLGAVYLQELGLGTLGSEPVPFGSPEFRALGLEVVVTLLVAAITTGFAAVNERELRRRRRDMEELAQLAMRLERADGPVGVAEALLDGIEELHGCSRSLVVRRGASADLQVIASRGIDQPYGPVSLLASAAPVVSVVLDGGDHALVVHRPTDGDAVLGRFPEGARLALVPLAAGAGGGALIVEHPAGAGVRMRRQLLELLDRYADHAAILMRNAELLDQVRALATTDGLTGLPNRRQLDASLDRACAQVTRGHGTVGVLMLDVDRFKVLNDTHGHQVGDEVLQHVAKVLDAEVRAGDLVGRYGGEEFTVVMPGAHDVEVQAAAERLRSAIEVATGPVPVTVSVGAAWAPAHGATRERLIGAADRALYEAKAAGRNRVALAPIDEPVVLDARAS